MKVIRVVLLLLLAGAGIIFYFQYDNYSFSKHETKEETVESYETDESETPSLNNGSTVSWIGEDQSALTEQLGEPDRVDPSSYGYDWHVYFSGNEYAQFGITDGKITTAFVIGNEQQVGEVNLGDSYEAVQEKYEFKQNVTYEENGASYTFELAEKDISMQPLVQIGDGLFAQFYFDSFTSQLTAVRVETAENLLLERPYNVTRYGGSFPEQPALTDEEWQEVDAGMEQQILDITNVIRNTHDLKALSWNDQVSEVAFKHSKDMNDQNYFSHVSLSGEKLSDRLAEEQVAYTNAGENIASGYIDAPAAMIGWLNSEGHRHALLDERYEELGVGVYKYYYTQNFLKS